MSATCDVSIGEQGGIHSLPDNTHSHLNINSSKLEHHIKSMECEDTDMGDVTDISSEDHAKMDEVALSEIEALGVTSPLGILSVVLQGCPMMDSSFALHKKGFLLLKQHPQLAEKIKDCYNRGLFQDIRMLPILRKPPPPPTLSSYAEAAAANLELCQDASTINHAALDKEVLATQKPGYGYVDLLSQIVRGYPEMDVRYNSLDTAGDTLESVKGLASVFGACVREGKFEVIRKLKIFRRDEVILADTTELKAARNAWKDDYVGDTHLLLLATINEMNTKRLTQTRNSRYDNFVAIIQSSGTGKSRAVDELAKHVFTIPFTFRDPRKPGFPFPDAMVQYQFLSPATVEEAWHLYLKFLYQLFTTVKDTLSGFGTEDSHKDLSLKWYQYLSIEEEGITNRRRLYEASMRRSSLASKSGNFPRTEQPEADSQEPTIGRLASAVNKAAVDLIALIKSKVSHDEKQKMDVQLLLYFDGAHFLVTKWGLGGSTLYRVLCSVLEVLKCAPVFTIFISTSFHPQPFAPPHQAYPSYRARDKGFYPLQDPITELPFDCHPEIEKLVRPDELTLDDVSSLGFMVKFGRPLFWSRWNFTKGDSSLPILHFAQSKLNPQNLLAEANPNRANAQVDGSMKFWTHHVAFATISQRVLLEFDPSRDSARRMEQEQVQSYMRYVYSVPSHREYLRSGAPSEPILAEAAALIMSKVKDEDIVRSIVSFVDHGLIGKGDRGQLVAQLLLTLAHDRAINTHYPTFPKSFSSPIPLITFLSSLFSDAKMDQIRNSYPDNQQNGLRFADRFANAFVRFTHFVKGGGSTVTTNAAFAGLARGFAFQCFNQQGSIDIIIPVHLGRREDKLSKATVTAMLISVKTGGRKESMPKLLVDEAELGFFSQTNNTAYQPYILIAMELGVEAGTNLLEPMDQTEDVGSATAMDEQSGSQLVHPRYTISAVGCSTETYKVAGHTGFEQLLGRRTVLEEHSRQDEAHLRALKRAKPFWNVGAEWYDWVNDDYLNNSRLNSQGSASTLGEFAA